MLNLAIITYAMPSLRGLQPYNQVLNMWSFWIMTSAMVVHDLHADLRRRDPDPHAARRRRLRYMDVQDQLALFYWMRLGAGVVVADRGRGCSSTPCSGRSASS